MSKTCDILKELKSRIQNGEDPEHVIPYSFECSSDEDFIEILHFAIQVLPENSPRRETCIRKLRDYAGR